MPQIILKKKSRNNLIERENILEKKISKIKLIDAKNIKDDLIQDLNNLDCLIIDGYENNIDEKLLYSLLNQSRQLENYVLFHYEHNLWITLCFL